MNEENLREKIKDKRNAQKFEFLFKFVIFRGLVKTWIN
jgi:hypothetical protein